MQTIAKTLALFGIVFALLIVILPVGQSYCVDKSEIARKRETIQKGFDCSTSKKCIKWGAGIESAPWLTFEKSEQEKPELKIYVDPEQMEASRKISRMLGVDTKTIYLFYKNKFCAVQMDGVPFKEAEEMYNAYYGHWTHRENLPFPYFGYLWKIGNIEMSLISRQGETWGQVFYSYIPIAKGILTR